MLTVEAVAFVIIFLPQWLLRMSFLRKIENALRARAFKLKGSCLVQFLFGYQRRRLPSFIQILTFLLSFWDLRFSLRSPCYTGDRQMLLRHRFSTRAFEIRDFLIGTVSIWVLKKALKKFYTNPHVASVFLAKTFTILGS